MQKNLKVIKSKNKWLQEIIFYFSLKWYWWAKACADYENKFLQNMRKNIKFHT